MKARTVLTAAASSLLGVALLAQPATAVETARLAPVVYLAAPTGPALLAPAAPKVSNPASVVAPAATVRVVSRPSGTNASGSPLAPPHAPPAPVGVLWGQNVDAQIRQAISQDNGAQTPYSDVSLAWGVALRSPQGWNDPGAGHYLAAALDQPNPYGLGYAWDAFQDGTLNPATTIYTITIAQVGDPVLDAYRHGAATRAQLTDAIDHALAAPRIPVAAGIGLAYSDAPADIRPGYSVHNVNQAIALFLQDALDAGITYRAADVQALVDGLNAFELASYNPTLNGWAYRDGGSQAIQDPAHAGVGVLWGQRFYPDTIGTPTVKYLMTMDFGYALGSGVHSSLAQFDCSDSRTWLPQYAEYMADPTFQDFGSSAKATPMMALSASACGAPSARSSFTLKSAAAIHATHTTTPHVAPDSMN